MTLNLSLGLQIYTFNFTRNLFLSEKVENRHHQSHIVRVHSFTLMEIGVYPMQSLTEAPVLEHLPITEYPSPQEEEIPMTLQVGLVGTDGLVIASDQKATFAEDRTRASSATQKLFWDTATGIVCAASGDPVAPHIARELVHRLIPGGGSSDIVFTALQGAVKELWQKHVPKKRNGEPDREPSVCFLIGLMGNRCLWRILLPERGSGTSPYLDKIHAGDDRNAAKYLTERFYKHSNLLPVSNLAFLAAHLILEGHELNPSGVEGLDILSWRFGEPKPKVFTEEEKRVLIRRSEGLSDLIEHKLWDTDTTEGSR
jgi:hypothetical protein